MVVAGGEVRVMGHNELTGQVDTAQRPYGDAVILITKIRTLKRSPRQTLLGPPTRPTPAYKYLSKIKGGGAVLTL